MSTEPLVAPGDTTRRARSRRPVTRDPRGILRGAQRQAVLRGGLPVGLLLVGMIVNFVVLLRHSSGVWFWADDWDLLFLRGNIPRYDVGLLSPHNNHWLSAHILVYRLLFSLFGMGSYTPYAAAAI